MPQVPSGLGPWCVGKRVVVRRRVPGSTGPSGGPAMTDLLAKEVTLTMPPNPFWFTGRDALLEFLRPTLDPSSPMFFGHWRHLPARANGQLAAGGYVRRPGTHVHRAQVLDVLGFDADDRITEITSFEPHLFPAFGLPLKL